jgi:hypothetical protein
MTQNWVAVLGNQTGNPWNIPEAEQTALDGLSVDAERLLGQAQSSARTTVITAECKAAFAALLAKMRFVKSRYFLAPPLSDADFTSLELQPKDTTRTPVPRLRRRRTLPARPPPRRLRLPHLFRRAFAGRGFGGSGCRNTAGTDGGAGFRRGASPFAVHSPEKEVFDFPAEDSGKTACFCVRYENAKGESGPWGPLFSAVIP